MVEDSYFEKKDIAYIAGMALLLLITVGSITLQVYDTGDELTCRTGNGWTILEEHEGFYEAQCEYKTKDWVTAYCSSFRSTASYERYGCNEVVLVEIDNSKETVIDNTVTEETIIDNTITEEKTIIINPVEYRDVPKGKQWTCPPNGAECVLVE